MKTVKRIALGVILTAVVANVASVKAGTKPSSRELTDKQVAQFIGNYLKGKDAATIIPKLKKKYVKDIEVVSKKMIQATLSGDVVSAKRYQNTLNTLGKGIKELDKRRRELGGVILLDIQSGGIAKD